MNKYAYRHTYRIFKQMVDDLPPLVPADIVDDIQRALEHAQDNARLTEEDVEQMVIVFGKKTWAYRQAYQELLEGYEGRLGETFLIGKLSIPLKKRYQEFIDHGGSFRDLHDGAFVHFFTVDERASLCEALIDIKQEIDRHARQAVLSVDRRKYEDRIVEFQLVLDNIEKRLETLRVMADDEEEHPFLADEIRSQIRGFEFGLSLLGPRIDYEAVCEAPGHFEGRKKDLRYARQKHITV